jgi:hypothetical protein
MAIYLESTGNPTKKLRCGETQHFGGRMQKTRKKSSALSNKYNRRRSKSSKINT